MARRNYSRQPHALVLPPHLSVSEKFIAQFAHTFSSSRGRSFYSSSRVLPDSAPLKNSKKPTKIRTPHLSLAPKPREASMATALHSERYLLVAPRNHLLCMLPPRAPPLLLLPHRRRRRSPASRVSSGDGGGGGGFPGAVEKRSVPEVVKEKGEERDEEGEVAGALELRWPPWEGLAERYKLIGATSLAFVICNMDKVRLVT